VLTILSLSPPHPSEAKYLILIWRAYRTALARES
jgi:hypothetical protein